MNFTIFLVMAALCSCVAQGASEGWAAQGEQPIHATAARPSLRNQQRIAKRSKKKQPPSASMMRKEALSRAEAQEKSAAYLEYRQRMLSQQQGLQQAREHQAPK